ncbi:MAG TPA: LPS export ABC transporter permease LptF [Nevskiales bacterium]|nr:LPS export ABC transporter permease LptF [Nevskiales bacterium]
MRLTLIDRYLLSETFKTWLAVTVVLAAIMLGNTFSQLLARTASGEFERALLLSLVGATSASYFKTLIPISLLLAILLSLGRLYRDNEMAVINACGIGLARLYRPFLLFGLVLALLTAWLSLTLEPAAKRRASQLRADARFATNLAATGSGQFQILAGGRGAVWAEHVSADQREMRNVLVWFRGRDGVKLIRAEQGFQRLDMATSEGDLLLVEGTRYEGNAGESDYQITRFRQHGLHLPVPRSEFNLNRNSTPTPVLLASDAAADKAEIQRRVSLPLMVIILVLLAVPLAQVSPRQGRYGRLVVGMLCYLLYSNLLAAAAVWVAQEELPASIGIWWIHALALGLIAWVFWPGQLWPSLRRQAQRA